MTIRDHLQGSAQVVEDPHRLLDEEFLTWHLLKPEGHSVGESKPLISFNHPKKVSVYLCIKDVYKTERWDAWNAKNDFDYEKTKAEHGPRPQAEWILIRPC